MRPYFHQLTDPLKSIIIQENLARTIIGYDPMALPGLHQIEPYARTLFEWAGVVARDQVDVVVKARMDRQN
ncbi:Scr1 family TA system antitoxin-like transcriptional regulator [Amycolatopsis sp. H20-H5]|uniref:Scr1 family TA system antitoxin-like transcriptional regulator n=1 Tax=Amycolatopsis sp. H20-H5 TaxID=3046309 RepID=UPI002DB94EE2|nr:Scr1 family TA system antitoxin-like transcriptional regulator [Amycolatopsis sp. H20-H5]MEC3974160.1 Scr1 family TA system antitoxin-like transcriptional regulator [Amycolatopsis sp. H20-H5]